MKRETKEDQRSSFVPDLKKFFKTVTKRPAKREFKNARKGQERYDELELKRKNK